MDTNFICQKIEISFVPMSRVKMPILKYTYYKNT